MAKYVTLAASNRVAQFLYLITDKLNPTNIRDARLVADAFDILEPKVISFERRNLAIGQELQVRDKAQEYHTMRAEKKYADSILTVKNIEKQKEELEAQLDGISAETVSFVLPTDYLYLVLNYMTDVLDNNGDDTRKPIGGKKYLRSFVELYGALENVLEEGTPAEEGLSANEIAPHTGDTGETSPTEREFPDENATA